MYKLNTDLKLDCFKINNLGNRVELIFEDGFKNQLMIDSLESENKTIKVCDGAEVEIIEFVTENSSDFKILNDIEVRGKLTYHQVFLSSIFENKVDVIVNVFGDGNYTQTLIDLNRGNSKINLESNIVEQGGYSSIYTALISGENNSKEVVVNSINHEAHSECNMSNFGICYDKGRLDITGIGDIRKGAHGSSNKQKSTMIVFDERAKASNKPLLLIDEDDVVANHASAVGKIDEQTIFYLCSRGLSVKQAKKYISLGHFKPVLGIINNEEVKEKILNYLEEVIKDD